MLFMFGFGTFIGFALGACLTLYMIDKEFEVVKSKDVIDLNELEQKLSVPYDENVEMIMIDLHNIPTFLRQFVVRGKNDESHLKD